MIIYVDSEGGAHTVDQAHKMALAMNVWPNIKSAIMNMWEVIKEATLSIIQKIKGMAVSICEMVEKSKIQPNLNWGWDLKRELKPRTNYIFIHDWRSSKKFLHRQRT